jgi:hypothetical protein
VGFEESLLQLQSRSPGESELEQFLEADDEDNPSSYLVVMYSYVPNKHGFVTVKPVGQDDMHEFHITFNEDKTGYVLACVSKPVAAHAMNAKLQHVYFPVSSAELQAAIWC